MRSNKGNEWIVIYFVWRTVYLLFYYTFVKKITEICLLTDAFRYPLQIRAEKPLFSSNPELDNLVSASSSLNFCFLLIHTASLCSAGCHLPGTNSAFKDAFIV